VPRIDMSDIDVSTAAPLAALGLGLAGAAAYLLTHRKKETLRDRISGFIGDTVDEGSDLAHKAYLEAEDFMKHEGRAATKEAKKRGRKLFNLGRAAAEKAYSEASDYAEHEGRDAAEEAMKRGRKLFKRGSAIAQKRFKEGRKVAEHAYEDISDYAQHEGRKKAKHFFARSEKNAKATLEKGRKVSENALDKWAERYPLLTGLLVAALLDQGQKYFQKNA
jgi:vacuolar-type H+-ATPase subunit H